MLQHIIGFESNILLWIQEVLRNDILTPFFVFITHLGDKGAIWIAIGLGLVIPKKTRKVGIMTLLALAGSYLINNLILKNAVARTRPYEVIQGLQIMIEKQKDLSFPSGHTASSFAAAVVLFKQLPKKYGVCALIGAVLISLSRLYVGVHYPTDVLCGALSGTLIAIMVCKGYSIISKQQ